MKGRAATVVWLREDLRLDDHPALTAATETGGPVVPLHIWSPAEDGRWAPGAASRWWQHHALHDLDTALAGAGARLILRKGSMVENLVSVCRATGAVAVYASRRYGPVGAGEESRAAAALRAAGIEWRLFPGALLFDPAIIATGAGRPYQVFTPFWRQCTGQGEPRAPLPPVTRLIAPARWPDGVTLADLSLLPVRDWSAGLARAWTPGAAGAKAALKRFLAEAADTYPEGRNMPGADGTSRLSPYLHSGELSAHRVWHAVRSAGRAVRADAAEAYLRQLVWREFAQHLLHHFPHTAEQPLRGEYAAFPWLVDDAGRRAWQKGQTGFPIVDAGMRQLWETGWMHNRVRMIVASFLVKDLLVSWQSGAAWFWDTLVDADLANNTLGWQWAAGCGADAAPYFRIFNPTLQGERFDPEGSYVRRYVPELGRLPARWIHQPAQAPGDVQRAAGVRLGDNYPEPMVSHTAARMRALAALKRMPSRREDARGA
ncbi:MAG: DNA photolyase family protein [Lentisphaerae bacterium]|nr:DNA photolyase family protein [Lentisphaerota bacterium]